MWRLFTEKLISYIGDNAPPSAWFLWGKGAKNFSKFINSTEHLIVKGRHPSNMRGTTGEGNTFFGGNYFNIANQFLEINGRGTIDWSLSSTGKNGLQLGPLLQTQIELQKRKIEEQQLKYQHEKNQGLIHSKERYIREMQMELEKKSTSHPKYKESPRRNKTFKK